MTVTGEQTVRGTTELTSLRIADSGNLIPPQGNSLTMTVDGVERNIGPGVYSGKIVLTVTPQMPRRFLKLDPELFRTAILIDNHKFDRGRSVPAAILSGTVGDDGADNLVLRSEGDNFNGVIVSGDSKYTLRSPRITMIGDGGNDFSGFGAAVMATDQAELTITDGLIDTQGVIRGALFVNGNAKVNIFDTRINVRNGVLPADFVVELELGKMKRVPWQMGVTGNARATMAGGNAEVHYKRSTIRSEGWGALSTDAPLERVRILVEDSLIETTDSGYGAFAIGDTLQTFRNSRFEVADVGLMMAGHGSGTFTDGTVVNSRRFGVVMFWYPRVGTLRIDKKSVFNTASTAIQIKDVGAVIVIDDAELNPGNGILIQAMPDDSGDAPGRIPLGPLDTTRPASLPDDPAVLVSIRNTKLTGDIVNGRTEDGELRLTLENATVTGRISTTIVSPATDQKPSAENVKLIGEVKNQYTATEHPNGLHLNLDPNGRWVVTGASYLTGLIIAGDASITGPDGEPAKITVNGQPVDAGKPGSYVGAIVVSPS